MMIQICVTNMDCDACYAFHTINATNIEDAVQQIQHRFMEINSMSVNTPLRDCYLRYITIYNNETRLTERWTRTVDGLRAYLETL